MKRFFPLIALFLLCVVGYSNSLHNGFMLDDYIILFGEKGVSNKSWLGIFEAHQGTFYRPVGHLYLMLSYLLFDGNPFGYHVANLLMFYAICVLFYKLVKHLSNQRLALVSSALYAVHPINSMLVNYVTASIIATFVLNSVVCVLMFLYFLEMKEKRFYGLSLLFFILSLLSHEMSLAIPFYLFCIMYFLKAVPVRRAMVWLLPFLVVASVYFYLRMFFFNFNRVVSGTSLAFKETGRFFASVVDLIGWYLPKLILPKDILFLWTGVLTKEQVVVKILFGLILVGFFVWLIFFFWKKGLKAFSLAVFLSGLFPVAYSSFTYYPSVGPIIEPHWFYFSSIGFFILAAMGILSVTKGLQEKTIRGVIAAILLVLIVFLQAENRTWRDQETYCRRWLQLNPRNLTPFYGVGKSLMDRGEYLPAVRQFQKGIDELGYNTVFLLSDAGYCYFVLGSFQNTQRFLQAAIDEDPGYSLSYHYAGLFFLKAGNLPQAELFFQTALNLYPKFFGSPEKMVASKTVHGLTEETIGIYRNLNEPRVGETTGSPP